MRAQAQSMLTHKIRDCDGKVIRTSRNLAGIRRYVANPGGPAIKRLQIDQIGGGEGKLSILFEDGSRYETYFADFTVLASWVYRWRNVRGAPTYVNGTGPLSRNELRAWTSSRFANPLGV